MTKKTSRWLSGGAGFLITFMICLGIYWAIRGPWLTVKQIQLEMDLTSNQEVLFRRIKADMIQKFQPWEGKKIWEISIRHLLKLVEEDSRVKRALVSRRFPDGIMVQIKPRDPVLGLVDRRGRIHPIATDASLLPALSPREAPDLPYLRGEEFFKKLETRLKAVEFVEQLPSHGMISVASISEIHFDQKEGFSIVLIGKGVRVLFGEAGFRLKFKRVEQVLYYLSEHQIDGRVIDARFSKKVIVRLRNQS